MADKGESSFNDPLGEYFDGFNIIEFMNDSDDLIESLAERSTSSKSSTTNKGPFLNTDSDHNSSRNTESVEGEWISPVPSDDFQVPQTATLNTSNFGNSSDNSNNNNVYVMDPAPIQQMRPILNRTYPAALASSSNQQQLQYPPQFISPQQSFNNNQQQQNNNSNRYIGPSPAKRKASDLLVQTPVIKREPFCDYGVINTPQMISPSISRMESNENLQQRQIQFIPVNMEQWATLYDTNQQPFNNLRLTVVADKGFNYSYVEGAFINQKKNHFQITVNVDLQRNSNLKYFFVNGSGILKEISEFKLQLCGIKAENPSIEIGLKQSNSERKLLDYEPAPISLDKQQIQIKVPRLHFSETTQNNARKAGKPNDQKYFQLAVRLQVYSYDGSFCIVQEFQSEKIIVRAGNPAQFDQNRINPQEQIPVWQNNKNLVYTLAPVSIGTDKQFPGAQLSVGGNIVHTGSWSKPSDKRVKEDIFQYDTRGATNRLAQVQVVEYNYKPEFAEEWGLDENNRHRIGVIAQQVAEVLPGAVKDNGEYLTVDENRIFMETVAAAQELYRVTETLDCKIGKVQQISNKLAKFNKAKFGSTISGISGLTYMDKKDDDGKSIYSLTSTSTSPENYRHQKRQREDMCSSKFTQYTVTFLIGIMALCLLAMCSLYILDWCRRVSNDPHGKLIPVFNYSDDIVGNLIEQKYGLPLSWLPDSQPLAPIFPGYLRHSLSKCEISKQCPMYCCENGMKHPSNTSLVYPDADLPGIDKNFYDSSIPLPFEHNFSLEIVNLNVSLDQRFCVEHSCRPGRGRYNLYIPMSPLLPTIPLKVKFRVKENKFVDNCGSLRDFFHKKCNNNLIGIEESEYPTSYTINENTFELSVGDFIQSAYRFRIGFTTESCNMSEDQRGRSYDEFILVFYRKCYFL